MRAAIYTRLSLDDGTKDSVERQEDECRRYCERHEWDVVGVYCDPNASAYNGTVRRPEFEKLLDAVDAGAVDRIVVYKLDRLTRAGVRGIVAVLDRVKAAGAELASVHDSIDTSTPMGEGVLGLLASIARQESENTSRRVKSANDAEARRGEMKRGGSRCFGYNDGRIGSLDGAIVGTLVGTVVEHEAVVVREVATRILADESLRQIAFDLNRRSIRTSLGNEWTSQSVGQMIRSPRLAGLRVHDGQRFEGTWDSILSHDTHYEVLRALDRPAPKRRAVRRHLLTGLAVCGVCDGPLKTMGFRQKNGKVFPRYQCVKQPGYTNCGGVAVSKKALDADVAEAFIDFVADGYMLPVDGGEDRISDLRTQIAVDRVALSELTRDYYLHRAVDRASYLSLTEELRTRIECNEQQVVALERQRDGLAGSLPHRGDRDSIQAWWDAASIEDQRSALESVLSKVVVNKAAHRGGNRFDATRVRLEWTWASTSAAHTAYEEHAPDEVKARDSAEFLQCDPDVMMAFADS